MATGGKESDEMVVNFDLLSGFNLSYDEIDVSNLSEEQQEALYRVMDTLQASQPVEKDDDYADFEKKAATHCHAICTDEQVDEIAAENNKKTTKWQTKWAVKVFKGTFTQLLPSIWYNFK